MSVGKEGSDINLLRWNFYLGYAIRNVQETNLELDMNDTHQVLVLQIMLINKTS
jgi:hypothetical protein